MPVVNQYRIYCETEAENVYEWAETEPTTCPHNTAHTIDEDSITIVDVEGVNPTDDHGVPIITTLAVQTDHAILVAEDTREGTEITSVSHDLGDPTTWYGESVRHTSQVCTLATGNVYDMPHSNIVDINHGKIFLEDRIAASIGHGYEVVVREDGVEATMRAPFADSGGDYEIDYENGKIVFFSTPTVPVTADYNAEDGSVYTIKPPTGIAYDIEAAEAQFTQNVVLNDTIQFITYGWVQVFAPTLWDGYDPPGPYPANTLIPLDTLSYKKMQNLIDEAQGAFPVIPAIGGDDRGTQSSVYGFPFRYGTARRLWAKYGMETHIRLEDDGKCTSSDSKAAYVTATIYYLEKSEADLT